MFQLPKSPTFVGFVLVPPQLVMAASRDIVSRQDNQRLIMRVSNEKLPMVPEVPPLIR